MTLQASGAISLAQLAAEFGLPANTPFPTGFYGKGGAPASGALSFADFYGRTNGTPAPSFTATPSSTSPSATASTVAVTTAAVTLTINGGTGPYSYAWTKLSGDAITAVSPTAASTQFRGAAMNVDEVRTAAFRCTVTDSLGATAQTAIVSPYVSRT
jgi:hypothetical protein